MTKALFGVLVHVPNALSKKTPISNQKQIVCGSRRPHMVSAVVQICDLVLGAGAPNLLRKSYLLTSLMRTVPRYPSNLQPDRVL